MEKANYIRALKGKAEDALLRAGASWPDVGITDSGAAIIMLKDTPPNRELLAKLRVKASAGRGHLFVSGKAALERLVAVEAARADRA